jgi:hypothetical protein
MKWAFILFSSILISMNVEFFSSCTNKNMQKSKQSKNTVKDSAQVGKPKTNTYQEKVVNTKNKEADSVLSLEEIFKRQHSKATNIVWAKDTILNKDINNSITYRLSYIEDEKKDQVQKLWVV